LKRGVGRGGKMELERGRRVRFEKMVRLVFGSEIGRKKFAGVLEGR
jgi:hypothetical protein